MLTADDLAYMQATQQQAMPGTVVIERFVLTPNGMGGATEAWASVGTVIGRIYPRTTQGENEAIAGSQVTSMIEWFGTFPVGTDVRAQDRVVYASRTWEVEKVNNDEMWQTATRCELLTLNEERRT